MPDMDRIVILGGSGQLGSLFRKQLQVQFPDTEILGTSRKGGEGLIAFDPFSDPWEKLGTVDVLVNAIGQIREEKGCSFEDIHIGITQRMIANREKLGNPRLVQISALGADAKHSIAFLRTKGQADDLLLAQPNTLVLRPSIVCTPDTMLLRKLRTLLKVSGFTFRKLFCPKGFPETRIQPILGEDLAHLLALLLSDPEKTGIVEAGGPEAVPFREVMAWVAAGHGTEVKWVEMPRDFFEPFVKHVVSPWFPNLLSYDQFRLLFEDNVVGEATAVYPEAFVARGTKEFWGRG